MDFEKAKESAAELTQRMYAALVGRESNPIVMAIAVGALYVDFMKLAKEQGALPQELWVMTQIVAQAHNSVCQDYGPRNLQ
mgnify:FL=1